MRNNPFRKPSFSRYTSMLYLVRGVKYGLGFSVRLIRWGFMTARRLIRKTEPESRLRALFVHYFPAWMLLAGVLLILLPNIVGYSARVAINAITAIPHTIQRLLSPPTIAPLFTKEVSYWSDDLRRWGNQYDLDPNLLATVMQIESCGHPTISSYAGAQGLFQVMPFHFDAGEDQLDPDTNAKRGARFLKQCLDLAGGDAGLGLACYNGGQSVLQTNFIYWSDQTRRYYVWGKGIYLDALDNRSSSGTLDAWLAAGGTYLCQRADSALGLN